MTESKRTSSGFRRASVNLGVIVAAGTLLTAGIGWSMMRLHSPASSLTMTSPGAITYLGPISQTLARIGLTPGALTAAGTNTSDITQIALAVRAVMGEQAAALESADAAALAAQGTIDRVERLVQSGQASEDDLSALAAARTSKSTADNTRSLTLAAVMTAATGAVSNEKAVILAQICANSTAGAPMKYRVAGRSDADWRALRTALTNVRVSGHCGQGADSACTALVASADAESATVAAASRLSTSLAENTTAWQAAAAAQN